MDVCDGGTGRDSHDWVAYTNDMSCPLCTMREHMEEEIDEWKTKYSDMELQGEDYRLEVEELAEKLTQYDGLEDSIKQMIKERM